MWPFTSQYAGVWAVAATTVAETTRVGAPGMAEKSATPGTTPGIGQEPVCMSAPQGRLGRMAAPSGPLWASAPDTAARVVDPPPAAAPSASPGRMARAAQIPAVVDGRRVRV